MTEFAGERIRITTPGGGTVATLDAITDVDAITEAQGQVLYRNATAWTALAAGTTGQYLQTKGAAANPVWAAAAGGGDVTGPGASVDNAIVRFNGAGGKTIQDYTSQAPTIDDNGNLVMTGTSTFNGPTAGISLSEIENLTASKAFTMAANNLTLNFTTPSDGLTLNATGAFADHLLHLHQSSGNPGVGTQMLHIQTEDTDVVPLVIDHTADNASYTPTQWQLNRATPTDNDNMLHKWYFDHDGVVTAQGELEFARLTVTATDVTEDSEDATFLFSTQVGGSLASVLTLGGTVTVARTAVFSGPVSFNGTLGAAFDMNSQQLDNVNIDGGTLSSVTFDGASQIGEVGIALDYALSADGKYSGHIEYGVAGSALAFGQTVYKLAASSRWHLTQAGTVAQAGPVKVGICVLAATGNAATTTILRDGTVRADASFPALVAGSAAYLALAAGSTVTTAAAGTTGQIVRVIGHGIDANSLDFFPDGAWVEIA